MASIRTRESTKQVLYKLTEAAQMLGCNRRTIHEWLEKGVLTAVQIPGGKRMVDGRSIERLLNNKVSP